MSQELLDYCEHHGLGTQKQRHYLTTKLQRGGADKAAAVLGIHPGTVRRAALELRKAAVLRGFAPDQGLDRPLPPGLVLKKYSTCYIDGEKKVEWVSSEPEKAAQMDMIREAVEHIIDPIKPKKRAKTPKKKDVSTDIATIYPLTDLHVGLKTHKEDTGVEDWGLDECVAVVDAATTDLVSHADPSDLAIVANLGDFFHTDNYESRTRKSGHQLDVDSRLPKTIRIGTHLLINVIDKALTKHRKVKVVNVPGNHDDVATVGLALALELYYSKEPRVEVDTSAQVFQHFEFGKCLRGFYHGHTAAPSKLEGVMATYWPEAWGRTTDRVVYTGHIHTNKVWELSGCLVESFSTVIPPDSWTSSMGYRARRGLCRLTLHQEWGEIRREHSSISRIKGLLRAT